MMRYKRILAAVLTVCVVLSLAIWKGPGLIKGLLGGEDEEAANIIESPENTDGDSNLRNTVLYYKDDKGYLVPVMRKIPWPEGKGIAKAALRSLVDNPANREDIEGIGLTPILPPNTEIRGMSINDGLCKVDFTKDFLNYMSKEEEQLIVKSLVYTLTEFPTIDEVRIMVDGEYVDRLAYGLNISKPLARSDINYSGNGKGKGKVIVYYQGTVNGLENYFVPITKDVEVGSNEEVTAIRALEALIEGPPENSGLFSVVPENLQVKNVDVVEGVAYVDFSEEIKNIEDSAVANDIVKAVALTLKEYYKNDANIEKVSILAEGEQIDFGGVSGEEPAVAPVFANEY